MTVWKKTTIRYLKNGKQSRKGVQGAEPVREESKRFYGTLKTASGKTKQQPLTEDEATSLKLLNRLQLDEDRKRSLGITQTEENRSKALSVFLKQYEKELASRGNTPFHVHRTIDCIQSLLATSKTGTLDELNSSRIGNVLSIWRKKGRPNKRKRKPIPLSMGRSNVYARAIKGFTRWLWTEGKADQDVLRSLKLLNADVDRRHKRRALAIAEIDTLLKYVKTCRKTFRGKTWFFKPTDREMLYLLAMGTGLRGSELASLKSSSFNLELKTVTVEAAYSKRRREDVLPLPPFLIERLQEWLSGKNGLLFPGTWAKERRQAFMLRRDLKAAGIEYTDDQNRHVDFHALRYTFISNLAKANVHPSKAQRLARHSDINLTMNVYTQLNIDDLREAVNVLPSF